MNMQTFRATTMAEALTQVKASMGNEAVILHTRTFFTRSFLGLRRREMVEITAGRGFNVPDRSTVAGRRIVASRQANSASAGALTGPSAYRANSKVTVGLGNGNSSSANGNAGAGGGGNTLVAPRNAVEGSRAIMETPAANNAVLMGLTKDVGVLRSMVQDLVQHARQDKAPNVPQELFDYYLQLVENQVAEDLATEVIRNLNQSMRPEHLAQPDYVRDRIADQLEKLIPTAGPIVRKKTSGPHVVALIGPTGVGKTTTIAKLAANLKLLEKHRVGLITLDTYRIAAVDQLKKYADILGSPLRVVNNGDDLRAAIDDMASCDFVLIDTAGRSPNDALKLSELKSLLAVAEPDEVHLVLSSTSSEGCMNLAVSRFSDVRVDRVLFTKIDEAAHVGVVVNVVRKLNKGLSYITTGQDVPHHIEVGKGKRLAQLILGSGLGHQTSDSR